MTHIYLDHSATTPTDPRVVDAMLPYFTEVYGNPSSVHQQGQQAERAIESARRTIAEFLNCEPSGIVFTSCGSESDNLAIKGVAWSEAFADKPKRLITTPIEHPAVSKTIQQLTEIGEFKKLIVPVDSDGFIDIDAFEGACRDGALLTSIIYANNELGTIQPIAQLAEIARRYGVLFHTDAVQAGGQLSLDVQALGVDMLSLSAHKFYGPKGAGLLYVRNGIQLNPSQSGGSHEQGRRAGTHNTPLIVGMAKALELAYSDDRVDHFTAMRDRLIDGVLTTIPNTKLTGHSETRLPSHASFVIEGVDGNSLLMHLDMNGVSGSSGSACKTGNPEPSDVLLAVGYSPENALSGLRLTVGKQTTADAIDNAVEILAKSVQTLRQLNHELAT